MVGKQAATGKKAAEKVLVAGRVLEAYRNGGYAAIVEEFGKDPHDPRTGKKMNVQEIVSWAINAYLGDEAKGVTAAQVMDKTMTIALRDGKAIGEVSNQISALRLAGQMSGAMVEKHEHTGPGGGPLVIKRVIVDGKTGEEMPGDAEAE